MTSPIISNELLEWVDVSFDGWKLKENAPSDIKEEFKKFMELISMRIDE